VSIVVKSRFCWVYPDIFYYPVHFKLYFLYLVRYIYSGSDKYEHRAKVVLLVKHRKGPTEQSHAYALPRTGMVVNMPVSIDVTACRLLMGRSRSTPLLM